MNEVFLCAGIEHVKDFLESNLDSFSVLKLIKDYSIEKEGKDFVIYLEENGKRRIGNFSYNNKRKWTYVDLYGLEFDLYWEIYLSAEKKGILIPGDQI